MQPSPAQSTNGTCLIVVPTYRERDNILKLSDALQRQELSLEVLVIDDGSDDGTQESLRRLQLKTPPVTVFQRHRKLGLGSAYVLAFSYACQTHCKYVIQMDADMSHDPADVPRLVNACKQRDVVIGSRYVEKGLCKNWPWYRYQLSRCANWLVRWLLQLPIRDATGGFKCIRREWLTGLPLERVVSTGFSFQWEFNQLAIAHGARFGEEPICFRQRTRGHTKMSLGIILEGLQRLLLLRWRKAAKGQIRQEK